MTAAWEEAERLLFEGDNLAADDLHEAALAKFEKAWEVLPEPKADQSAAVSVLGAIADCLFHLGRWEGRRDTVQRAFHCGGDLADPFLRLRIGQALYELGDELEAANWLAPAYLSEGRALFDEDDPKYLEFRSKLLPPPGGWPDGW